jgi:glycosyltransferase involved in cell wall biosynthesis
VWLKKVFRKKLIARCGFLHGFFTRQQTDDPRRIADAEALEKTAFGQADMVVVTSGWQKQIVAGDYGIRLDKIKVIPNYVVTDTFKPDLAAAPSFDLVFAGRSHSQKNLPNLFEALRMLKARGKSYSLNMIGGCCNDPELVRLAEGLDITFSGNKPTGELPGVLNGARAFVMPSHYEGHPKALLEAMSCGIACIGADVPGIREDIRHMDNGYLCRTTPESIAGAIETVCGSDEIRAKLGGNARRYIVDNYDIGRIVELELDAIREVQSL